MVFTKQEDIYVKDKGHDYLHILEELPLDIKG